jgi:hypothetical protein
LAVERGARIGSDQMLCNGPLRVLLVMTTTVSLWGCTKDDSDMEASDAGEAGMSRLERVTTADAAIIPTLPVAPMDLFRHFPKPPAGVVALPGDGIEKLTEARDRLRDSYYSPRVLVEHPENSPFRIIHYQLTTDGSEVAAVLLTFDRAYSYADRKTSLEEAITLRVGKGKKYKKKQYQGTRWKIMDFRIDLRTDASSPYVELLLHKRGSVNPTAAGKRR